jgi:DNA invertase Pin-like site-specific DNA recombinase
MEKLFICYYRVSTQKQNISGLGLEAQKDSVHRFINYNGNKIVAEFTEVESGKNDNRPELKKALQLCREKNATLVIAKLDRLSRNLTFLSQLMDSKTKFIACDMPDASELTISIFASLAQWERKRISQRTIEALQAKKQRQPDWKAGTNNLTAEGRKKAYHSLRQKSLQNENNRHAFHFIAPLREKGYSWTKIADMLNAEGYRTRKGCKFFPWQTYNLFQKFSNVEK